MCRCFAADLDWDAIAARFDVDKDATDPAALPAPSYNLRPKRTIGIVAQGRDGRRHLAGAYWSLIPAWSADKELPYPTYNARVESACVKPTFAESAKSMRAIIPATGYYEYHGHRPYYFHAPNDVPLLLAGLFSWWRAPQSQGPAPWLLTATILTCQAVDGPAAIHDRMPLLVPHDMTDIWLDRAVDGTALMTNMQQGGIALSRKLAFHEVASFGPTGDGRTLIRPLPQPHTPSLF
ncbi:SOS response associated peptidase (SRAP) [Bifidobacterium ramosum]|uniref:Abasic site processing protein n=1 Tax=Bifidobacterium ramosum TaxID=1798158 RepID=A0A6L4X312_9BIFI|nr:SOS response-associated peptidase [Bifidobacterium ramosum]KAB8289401.1 SOS response associated peptidase (SRAP) [Bifidobacterium ramosum]NEG71100.1 SOS response-associated peptidase [Bifidobacterium ramosum]